MKKDWLKRFLAGIGIGVASSVPGVSGGTIMVILKVYEGIIWAISNLFKQFKKAFKYLLPILLGALVAVIPMVVLMKHAIEGFLFGAVCIFGGFIVGSIPSVTDEIKGEKIKPSFIVILVISFIIALGVAVASVFIKPDVTPLFENPKWWFYLLLIPVGIFASAALVVPGISGGMLLILIGFYNPIITSTGTIIENVFHGVFTNFWTQIGLLACFFIGVVIGFIGITMIMNVLLKKFRTHVFYGILGFIIGSTIALFYNHNIVEYYIRWSHGAYIYMPLYVEIPIGVVLFIGFGILAYLLAKVQRKQLQESHNPSTIESKD